jgi:hypothetical protein
VLLPAGHLPILLHPLPLLPLLQPRLLPEGYAINWWPVVTGRLASDCRSKIHVWKPTPAGKWALGTAYK